MKYLILAMVCIGCAPVTNTPAPVATPVIVTVRQLPGVLIVGESFPMEEEPEVIKTWYSASDAEKLKAAIEAAVAADKCKCAQGDPLCDCLPSE